MLRFPWHSCLRRQVEESSKIRLPGLKIHHFGGQQMLTPVCLSFPLYTADMLALLASVGRICMWCCVGEAWPQDQHKVNRTQRVLSELGTVTALT